MFRPSVNAVCNVALFSTRTMSDMGEDIHESAARLYAAAKQLAGIAGKSAVARLLNESPQAVNNWERRGISEGGALKAQAAIGCDAIWLLTGKGSPDLGWPFTRVPMVAFLALEPEDRAYIEGVLASEIERLSHAPSAEDLRRFAAHTNAVPKKSGRRKAA
jgi:hypothetical protein